MDTAKATELFTDLLRQLDTIKTGRDENLRDAFQRRLLMLIRQFFTDKSEYLRDANQISWYGEIYSGDTEAEQNADWAKGWNKTFNLIITILEDIKIQSPKSDASKPVVKAITPSTTKVFIVHGHDEAMKEAVARTLGQLDLEPIILHEQPNKGRTIIEKFSDYSDVGFAVVLLTGDDLAYSKGQRVKSKKPRARQNVILELGYFIGTLGRQRVLPLYKKETGFEIPSDYSGVVFIPFDKMGKWKLDLVRELLACGFKVDSNKLVS